MQDKIVRWKDWVLKQRALGYSDEQIHAELTAHRDAMTAILSPNDVFDMVGEIGLRKDLSNKTADDVKCDESSVSRSSSQESSPAAEDPLETLNKTQKEEKKEKKFDTTNAVLVGLFAFGLISLLVTAALK